jgi:hypothetical protein
MVAVAADEGVTCHVMVGFSDSAVGKAETAAVSEATTTTGRAAATATGHLRNVHGTRLDGCPRPCELMAEEPDRTDITPSTTAGATSAGLAAELAAVGAAGSAIH